MQGMAFQRHKQVKELKGGVPSDPKRNVELLHVAYIQTEFPNFSKTRIVFTSGQLTPCINKNAHM